MGSFAYEWLYGGGPRLGAARGVQAVAPAMSSNVVEGDQLSRTAVAATKQSRSDRHGCDPLDAANCGDPRKWRFSLAGIVGGRQLPLPYSGRPPSCQLPLR